MITTISRHGDKYILVIDKPIMDLLKIAPGTPLEMTSDGHSLVVAPVRDDDKGARLERARKAMHARYARTFRKLAE